MPAEGSYELYLLKYCNEKVTKCYGCKRNMKDNNNCIPSPPNDMTIVSKTRRTFYKNGISHTEKQPGNVYFHASAACVTLHNNVFLPSLLHISDAIKSELDTEHKEQLRSIGVII